jgi:hypothetical protein
VANGKIRWIVVPCHRVIGTNGRSLDMQADCGKVEHENPTTQQSLIRKNINK